MSAAGSSCKRGCGYTGSGSEIVLSVPDIGNNSQITAETMTSVAASSEPPIQATRIVTSLVS